MIKIFITVFFFSEIIIATAIISKLVYWRKCVNNLNEDVLFFQRKVTPFFIDVRLLLEDIVRSINNIKNYILRKRREYLTKALNSSIIYLILFLLKGKYKKAFIACMLGKDICEGVVESVFS